VNHGFKIGDRVWTAPNVKGTIVEIRTVWRNDVMLFIQPDGLDGTTYRRLAKLTEFVSAVDELAALTDDDG